MTKKTMLLAVFATALAASASPFSGISKHLHGEADSKLTAAKCTASAVPKQLSAPSRATSSADELYYCPAYEPYTALSFKTQTEGSQVGMALQIDPEFLKSIPDCKVTSITFFTGATGDEYINTVKTATVFVTDDLTSGKYLYTQDVTDLPSTSYTQVDVALSEAVALPAGKDIYVGMYCTVSGPECGAIVVDGMAHETDYGGWVARRTSASDKWSWSNVAESRGFVNIGATISSPNLPKNSVQLDQAGCPAVVNANTPFTLSLLLTNMGANEVKSLTVEYGLEGGQQATATIAVEDTWLYGQTKELTVDNFVISTPSKLSTINVKVSGVDGVANTNTAVSGSCPVTIVPEGSDLPRNIVIEEFTSTKCQWCPVGYTSMEMIRENYTDGSIIPVAVHVNFGGTDPMRASTYNSVYQNYGADLGLPSAMINRRYAVYPEYSMLIEAAEEVLAMPAVGTVEATATFNESTRKLTVNTTTSFAFDYTDGDKNFILSYGITEDNVGPYSQKNGYSGDSEAVLGDWQDRSASVSLVYNDVARQLETYFGITGSIPAEIKAGENYSYAYEFDVLTAVKDMKNSHIVVYLINTTTGVIENACTLTADIDTGVEMISVSDNNAPVEYYNLQGIRVEYPSTGLYIRCQGTQTTKELIK